MSTTEAYLDLHRHAPVAMLDHEITDRRAWTRETVRATDWTVTLGDAAITEVLALAATLDHQPLPVLMLSPDQFALGACREAMARVRAILRDGIGVALLDRLPLDGLTREQAIAAYWVLGQLIATPVAQKWDGTMIYDVTDTGRQYGYGVRGSWTNVELSFHTDNSFGGGATRLRGPPVSHARARRRNQPLLQPLHRAQRDAPAPPPSARAPLPAVLLRSPGRARVRRSEGVVGALLPL